MNSSSEIQGGLFGHCLPAPEERTHHRHPAASLPSFRSTHINPSKKQSQHILAVEDALLATVEPKYPESFEDSWTSLSVIVLVNLRHSSHNFILARGRGFTRKQASIEPSECR
jgi:hypothetical protein